MLISLCYADGPQGRLRNHSVGSHGGKQLHSFAWQSRDTIGARRLADNPSGTSPQGPGLAISKQKVLQKLSQVVTGGGESPTSCDSNTSIMGMHFLSHKLTRCFNESV